MLIVESDLFKKFAKAALAVSSGGAMCMTLMACYGSPALECQDYDDADGDGAYTQFCQDEDGTVHEYDCDDEDDTIYTGADDPEGDGIDQNCDGEDGVVNPEIDAGATPEDGGTTPDDAGAGEEDGGQAADAG